MLDIAVESGKKKFNFNSNHIKFFFRFKQKQIETSMQKLKLFHNYTIVTCVNQTTHHQVGEIILKLRLE